jgi:PmbA protein
MEELNFFAKKLSSKVDEYEIVRKKIDKISLTVKKGKIEDLKESKEVLYTLRIVKNKKTGLTYFTSVQDIDNILNNVVALSEISDRDEFNTFYNNEFEENKIELSNKEIDEITLEHMKDFSLLLEECSYKRDKRISNVKDAGFFKGKTVVSYFNSNNIAKEYATDYCGASVVVVAKDNGNSMMGYEYVVSKRFDFNSEKVAETAVNKAVRMLNAKKSGTYKFPVIIENELAGDILSILAPSFFIENLRKNKSMLSNIKDKKIASDNFVLVDDGINPEFVGSALFDDEGTPTNKKYLIKNGMLNEFLYNYYYAKKEGKNFAGNGFLPSFKASPSITYTNLILSPGDTDFNDFIRSLQRGILLTNLMGLHTADPVSGDFSLGGEGILIENGNFSKPVKEFVISGNIIDILKNCKIIFNDLKVNGRIISPSILVEGLKIVGN